MFASVGNHYQQPFIITIAAVIILSVQIVEIFISLEIEGPLASVLG